MQEANFTVVIAFLGGLFSFLSPCVLPLVPGYMSLISGVSINQLSGEGGSRRSAFRAVVVNSLAFNAGLSMIFLTLGAAAGLVGAAITSNPWIRITGGIIVILFGLQLMGILKIGALYKDTRFFSDDKPRGPLGSFTLGLAFAAGWTPCIGPILGGIIGLAATSGGWRNGLLLSAFYSAGLALPFLLTGLLINQFLGFYAKFRKHLHTVEVVSGVLLIAIGILIATGYSTKLNSSTLAGILPSPETWLDKKTATAAPVGSPTAPPVATNLEPLPDATLKDLKGETVKLSDLRGHVVVLNFWATWCVPCRAEIPELNAMQKEMESRGLSVVGVSFDATAKEITEFQKDIKQDYTLLLADENLKSTLGVGASFPTTIIVDRDGKIRKRIIGARDRSRFEAEIKPLLDEAPATAKL
ncbi:MAG: cytochrome c-type biosis protein [Blastocatellia bacterium]|jgi:cytochrome c-type biogenesis protein|nr:cytochrome c-type biosis protein [Blastocatellia bacterium]